MNKSSLRSRSRITFSSGLVDIVVCVPFLGIILFLLFGRISIVPDAWREMWERAMDSGHLILFLVVTAVSSIRFKPSSRQAFIARILGLILFLICVELIQPFFERSFSWIDIANGIGGVLFGAFLTILIEKRMSWISWFAYLTALFITLCASFSPVFVEFQAYLSHRKAFPILGDFEGEADSHYWRIEDVDGIRMDLGGRSKRHSIHGSYAFCVFPNQNDQVGITFRAGDSSIRGYRYLHIPIYVSASLEMMLRIDDDGDTTSYSDRFNKSFHLTEGWNLIRLPVIEIERGATNRLLNVDRIRRIIIFTSSPSDAQYCVDYVRVSN